MALAAQPYKPMITSVPKTQINPDFDTSVVRLKLQGNTPGLIENLSKGVEAYTVLDTATAHALQTITITNVGSDGDTLTATIRGVAVVYTKVTADNSVTKVAQALVALINSRGGLIPYVTAANAAGVVTVTANYPGQIPNTWGVTVAVTGTLAATAGDTTLLGGTGNIVTPLENFTIQVNRNTIAFVANRPIVASLAVRNVIATSGFAVS